MPTERIEHAEERIAWLERHVTEQDKAMLEMAQSIDRLRAELTRLRMRAEAGGSSDGDGEGAGGRFGAEERPPHY